MHSSALSEVKIIRCPSFDLLEVERKAMNAGAWRAESGLRAMKQSLTGRVSHLWRVGPQEGSELTIV